MGVKLPIDREHAGAQSRRDGAVARHVPGDRALPPRNPGPVTVVVLVIEPLTFSRPSLTAVVPCVAVRRSQRQRAGARLDQRGRVRRGEQETGRRIRRRPAGSEACWSVAPGSPRPLSASSETVKSDRRSWQQPSNRCQSRTPIDGAIAVFRSMTISLPTAEVQRERRPAAGVQRVVDQVLGIPVRVGTGGALDMVVPATSLTLKPESVSA